MGDINITREDCNIFPGGWSVKPDQMYYALRQVTYRDKLNIIEFGAGLGTYALVQLLEKLDVPFNYVSYEDDEQYACTHPKVRTVLWHDFPTALVRGKYDLVILDGPAGLRRTLWYPLLRRHVRRNTIMLIDDFRHFKEFKETLDDMFKYTTIVESGNIDKPKRPWLTWIVVRILSIRDDKPESSSAESECA